ncbi:multidrug ABC transporter permease [Parascardovia denticolens]
MTPSRFLRIARFELGQFASVCYFVQTVIFATLSACIVQRLGVLAWHSDPYLCFLRSAAIGMWTSAISATGIIGFERSKGTLVCLVSGRTNIVMTLVALVSSVATFSLISFPLACLFWLIPGRGAVSPAFLGVHLPLLIVGMLLFWLATLSITFVMALISVITPRALAYEGLILTPALFFSGIFPIASPVYRGFETVFSFLLPTTSATTFLYSYRNPRAMVLSASLCLPVTALWMVGSRLSAGRAFRAMRTFGTVEVI